MDKDTEDAFKLLGKNMQTGFDNIQKSLESIKADMTTKQDLESIKADMDRRCSPAQTE